MTVTVTVWHIVLRRWPVTIMFMITFQGSFSACTVTVTIIATVIVIATVTMNLDCDRKHVHACINTHTHTHTHTHVHTYYVTQDTEKAVNQIKITKIRHKKYRQRMCFLTLCISMSLIIVLTFVWNTLIPHF